MGSFAIKAKGGQGTVHAEKTKKGGEVVEEHHEQELVGPVVTYGDEPTANVNVSLGARIGLPNYSDYRVNVSLTLPANLDKVDETGGVPGECVERAYAYALEWCQKKITDLTGKELVDA